MATREAILHADASHVWHPYAPSRANVAAAPLVIARASGVWLEDADGKRYIDGNSSWYTATLGHSHPRVVRAIAEQAKVLAHTAFAGITHEPGALLAEELLASLPAGYSRVFYTDNGSTSIEASLRMALHYWQKAGQPKKKRFVALNSAFHGDTLGATSLGGIGHFTHVFGGNTLECVHVKSPADGHEAAFAHIARVLKEESDSIAAVVVEPLVQAAGGMLIYPAAYLAELARACEANDVLLIVDEVFTGYGRTGTMWASEQAGVTADILCLGKTFASPIPMGAVVVTPHVSEMFVGNREDALMYGHTFCGNPLGAAVAREVLSIFKEESIVASLPPKIEKIRNAFFAIKGARPARALGMVAAIDLGDGGYLGDLGWRVYEEAKARGAYLRPLGDTVYVTPPLVIGDRELDALLSIVEESVRAVTG